MRATIACAAASAVAAFLVGCGSASPPADGVAGSTVVPTDSAAASAGTPSSASGQTDVPTPIYTASGDDNWTGTVGDYVQVDAHDESSGMTFGQQVAVLSATTVPRSQSGLLPEDFSKETDKVLEVTVDLTCLQDQLEPIAAPHKFYLMDATGTWMWMSKGAIGWPENPTAGKTYTVRIYFVVNPDGESMPAQVEAAVDMTRFLVWELK
jgi:hypothetical protein